MIVYDPLMESIIWNLDCCCLTEEKRIERRLNSDIEIQLRKDKLKSKQEIKLLLLGTGESGKSTFVRSPISFYSYLSNTFFHHDDQAVTLKSQLKQMKIIHGDGFLLPEKIKMVTHVHRNILVAIKSLIRASETLGIPLDSVTNTAIAQRILILEPTLIDRLTEAQIADIRHVWSDWGIKETFRRRNEFPMPDSASYFLTNLERISRSAYLPTEQDILRARTPTTGINEHFFTLDEIPFRVVDVGGQRSERRKWIHCFDSVTSVIFIAALSEYDQPLEEGSGTEDLTRMEESLDLFQNLVNYVGFVKSSFILFLNKKDIFDEKILSCPLKSLYPQFDGPDADPISAMNFILDLYKSRNLNMDSSNRDIYSHFTTATDTDNIRVIFSNVKDTILTNNLKEYILS